MPEYAPGFDGANKDVLPKNTSPLSNRLVTNALVNNVTGAAAGTNVNVAKARVQHNLDRESRRAIESESLINRNSTAADVTALKSKLIRKRTSLTFPRDLSGNGGPAFVRS